MSRSRRLRWISSLAFALLCLACSSTSVDSPDDPATVIARSVAAMRAGAVRLEEETLGRMPFPTVGIFSRDDSGRVRWESRYEDPELHYSITNLCIFDGEVLRVCFRNKKGRVVVSSATRDELAAANARRPPGPPGPYGAMDPAAGLELWASVFALDRVVLEDDRGAPCWVMSGKAGPWFTARDDTQEDQLSTEARAMLQGAQSIRIRIRRDNFWIRTLEILDGNGEAIRSTRFGEPDLHPTFDAATFAFQRPPDAEDAPFFPKDP